MKTAFNTIQFYASLLDVSFSYNVKREVSIIPKLKQVIQISDLKFQAKIIKTRVFNYRVNSTYGHGSSNNWITRQSARDLLIGIT